MSVPLKTFLPSIFLVVHKEHIFSFVEYINETEGSLSTKTKKKKRFGRGLFNIIFVCLLVCFAVAQIHC